MCDVALQNISSKVFPSIYKSFVVIHKYFLLVSSNFKYMASENISSKSTPKYI
jgi:hypothetical protein